MTETSTETLRRLLDERGAEWKDDDAWNHAQKNYLTTWKCDNGKLAAFSEIDYPHMVKLRIYDCAPAQAIAATLGSGECECDGTLKWVWTGPTAYYEHELSCGHVITSVDEKPPNFCEECGAKVIGG